MNSRIKLYFVSLKRGGETLPVNTAHFDNNNNVKAEDSDLNENLKQLT